ncbi:unnamed protein product, partial [Rotaria socialis]
MLNNSDDFDYLRHQLLTTSTDITYDTITNGSPTDQNHDKKMQNQVMQPTDSNALAARKRLIV